MIRRTLASASALLLALGATSGHAAQILAQDFEAGSPPAGWTRSQNSPSVGFEFGTALGSQYFNIPSHTRYAASNDDAHDASGGLANVADRDRLITPALNLTAYSGFGILLTFQYLNSGQYGSTAHVEASTDGGVNWVNVATLAPSAGWTQGSVALNGYAGLSNVRFAFRHNDHGNWADGLAVDDVLLESVPARDIALDRLSTPQYVSIGSQQIRAEVTNRGGTLATSIGLRYRVAGGSWQSATIGGLSLASGLSTEITHPLAHNFAGPGDFVVDLGITSVNGQTDLNPLNDDASGTVHVLTSLPTKKVVLEQHTGAWGQFCPDGTVVWNQVRASSPNVIAVSVHNGDAMVIADGTTLQGALISAYPSGTVDRRKFDGENAVQLSRGAWMQRAGEALGEIEPVEVSLLGVSFNAQTRQLSATVRASFVGNSSGDQRLNLWVVEDALVVAGVGYDQTNYYNTQAGHPYYGAGNPIVNFRHDGVVRAMLAGPWGQMNSVAPTVIAGETYSHVFAMQLPASVNASNVRLVGVLQRYDEADVEQRRIVNATQWELMPLMADGFE